MEYQDEHYAAKVAKGKPGRPALPFEQTLMGRKHFGLQVRISPEEQERINKYKALYRIKKTDLLRSFIALLPQDADGIPITVNGVHTFVTKEGAVDLIKELAERLNESR